MTNDTFFLLKRCEENNMIGLGAGLNEKWLMNLLYLNILKTLKKCQIRLYKKVKQLEKRINELEQKK